MGCGSLLPTEHASARLNSLPECETGCAEFSELRGELSSLPPTGFGLSTSLAWGTSNFLGGFASRRGNPFLLATISNFSALSSLFVLAAVLRAPSLLVRGQIWSLLAGTAGGCALAILYGALSSGHMGMASPVVAVLSVGIPATVTTVRVGSPGLPRLLGFALAILGVSLIGKTKDKKGKKFWEWRS